MHSKKHDAKHQNFGDSAQNEAKFSQNGVNLNEQDGEILDENFDNGENLSAENAPNADENAALKAELEAWKDKFMRANAEFENIKKRLEREKDSALSYANESFARDLLVVIDALEAALKVEAEDEVSAKIKEGVQNTLDLFIKQLEKHGVREIDASGEFDPNLHQGIAKVDSAEHSPNHIVNVLTKGYQINDRVLRSAMVSIAK